MAEQRREKTEEKGRGDMHLNFEFGAPAVAVICIEVAGARNYNLLQCVTGRPIPRRGEA